MRRNHTLASVIEAFVAAHPEHDRTAEEKADLDKANTITEESVRRSAVSG